MILLANKLNCTGCSACLNACSKQAIKMKEDQEGFLIPTINDSECVECHLCEKVCPIINPPVIKHVKQNAYAFISYKDKKVSSSGGAFSVFARYVLQHGGVVYGASFFRRENNGSYQNVFPALQHIMIEKEDDLYMLRGSKYLQSNISLTYREAFDKLRQGRWVLFSGTPCQISGLYSYIGRKEYKGNLITLDLVCHGVPSQEYFTTYLKKLKKESRKQTGNMEIEGFHFRKLDSWSIIPSIKFEGKKWRMLEQEDNSFMNSFFKQMIFRECCYRCPYSNMKRVGSFTIADYWGIGRDGIPFKKNISSGVSLVIDNMEMFEKMSNELCEMAYIEKRPLEEGKKYNHNLNEPSMRPTYRDTSVLDMLDPQITLLQYARKYGLIESKLWYYIKHSFKVIVYNLGIYNFYKEMRNKIEVNS